MRRNVEVVSCDFCGEDIEGFLTTAKVRTFGEGELIDKPVRLYNQVSFNWCGTRFVYDICSKCRKKADNGELCISTDNSADRSFVNG